jgi:hypothetical protein
MTRGRRHGPRSLPKPKTFLLGDVLGVHYNERIIEVAQSCHSLLAVIGALTLVAVAMFWVAPASSKQATAPPATRRALLTRSQQSPDERYLALLKRYLVRYDFGPTLQPLTQNSRINPPAEAGPGSTGNDGRQSAARFGPRQGRRSGLAHLGRNDDGPQETGQS